MVDCDLFTDFNRELIQEKNKILLDYKNCDYTVELNFPYTGCTRVPRSKGSSNFLKKIPIKAVYGIVEMEVNSYLAFVTKAAVIGQIYHRKVFQVQKMELLCLAAKEAKEDHVYVQGLKDQFKLKCWYFSDDYDLTNSLQKFVQSNNSKRAKELQYMYNSHWIDDFVKIKAYEWITGFISGFISINFMHSTATSSCELALITRRSKERQGRRWITRGCDLDGNSANTAETQTIFMTESNGKQSVFSHVQLRGSIPVAWKQTPDLAWSPKVTIHPNDKLNAQLMLKNYESISKNYENCLLVNLIDQKGSQKKIGDYFQRTHRSVEKEGFKLIWFDFHAECKNMKYENLSKLLDQIEVEMDNFGYFHIETVAGASERASKKNLQKGIIRTNCMDCLDRTNVVQSVFARHLLLTWLAKVNMIAKSRGNSAFEKLPDQLEEIFRSQWTQNADLVSILYSGTPAMKTDFTATGKRTKKGAFNDGYYGFKRYFLGNFFDSRHQDMIDFSLGKINPRKNDRQRIRPSLCNSLLIILILIGIAVFCIFRQIDSYMPDQITGHFKLISLLLTVGLGLFIAKQLRSVVLRDPIRITF